MNEVFPPKYIEENINSYVKNIESCYHFSRLNGDFDFDELLSFVSSHFTEIDEEYFLKLPRHFQHWIISRPELQIESEDSLFDIIIEIIRRKDKCDKSEEIDDILFLELIEFNQLSENRLQTFFEFFDFNDLNGTLWNKLIKCFFKHSENNIKPSIIVGGFDGFNQFGENPNNIGLDVYHRPIISPPLNSTLDSSSLLSYSIYGGHSVLVTKGGSLLGIGDNHDGRISSSLAKTKIDQFTEFSIKDDNGHQLTPVSAICSLCGTLYMFSKISGKGRQLVYCDKEINGGNPVFLDIGEVEPVSLFGGFYHAAAISEKGDIIFINRYSVKNSPNSHIAATSLPDGEKASCVSCLEKFVFVLSSNGRVFSSLIESGSNNLRFSAVSELANEEIICISGTHKHCLAVNKEGRIFGFGSNEYGQLGIGDGTKSVSLFTEISSFKGYKIIASYAGGYHSLFETCNGQILSCGNNDFGQLLLNSGPSIENVYSPRETTITGGSIFCIAGSCLNAVFIGRKPPPNTPNMRIQQ